MRATASGPGGLSPPSSTRTRNLRSQPTVALRRSGIRSARSWMPSPRSAVSAASVPPGFGAPSSPPLPRPHPSPVHRPLRPSRQRSRRVRRQPHRQRGRRFAGCDDRGSSFVRGRSFRGWRLAHGLERLRGTRSRDAGDAIGQHVHGRLESRSCAQDWRQRAGSLVSSGREELEPGLHWRKSPCLRIRKTA